MTVPNAHNVLLLEGMIDLHGLFEVLVALDVICGDKAAHIRSNGGPDDMPLARDWQHAGEAIAKLAKSKPVERVSPL